MNQWLSVSEVAAESGISAGRLRVLIGEKRLPAVKIAGRLAIHRDAVPRLRENANAPGGQGCDVWTNVFSATEWERLTGGAE